MTLEEKVKYYNREYENSGLPEGIKAEDVTLDYVSSLKNEAKNHDKGIQNKIDCWIEQSGN